MRCSIPLPPYLLLLHSSSLTSRLVKAEAASVSSIHDFGPPLVRKRWISDAACLVGGQYTVFSLFSFSSFFDRQPKPIYLLSNFSLFSGFCCGTHVRRRLYLLQACKDRLLHYIMRGRIRTCAHSSQAGSCVMILPILRSFDSKTDAYADC